MRIGLFSDAYLPDVNGVVSSIATLKGALEDLGHTVFVISNHKGMDCNYDQQQRILRLPGIEMKKMYGYKMSSPIQFVGEEYIKDMNLDIIHVHTEIGIGMFARHMSKKYNIPLVYTYHTMYEDYIHYVNPKGFETIDKLGKKAVRFLSKIAGNSPMGVIVPSNKTKKALQSYGVKTPIYIVPTGIDLTDYDPSNVEQTTIQAIRQECGLSMDDLIIGFVGRIAKEKCIEMPIEAMTKINNERLHLVIVGGGTDMKFYQNLVSEYGLEDRVHFVGRVEKEQVPQYYASFDAFVSASVSETQGMTYLEALASGLVVFGRRDEVLDELIEEGLTGFYFDDADELSQKMDAFFLQDIQDRQQGRQACIEKTKAYNPELFGQKVLAVYQQAIDDYSMAYEVKRISVLKNGFVQLALKRKKDPEAIKVKIPDEEFFDLKITRDTMLDSYTVSNYIELQDFYAALVKVKRRVLSADYTSYEISKYCQRRLHLTSDQAQGIVQAMMEANLINDHQYALHKSSVWHDMGQGKIQIANKLRKAGVREDWIQEGLNQLDNETELNNATKVATRLVKTIRYQSSRLMRQSLIDKLVRRGFSLDIARRVGENIELSTSDDDILLDVIEKAKRLYAHKEGQEKLQKIRLYCMRKGFTTSQVDEVLEREKYD